MPPTCTPTSLTTLGPGSVAQAGSQLLAELRPQLRSARLYPNGKKTKHLSPRRAAISRDWRSCSGPCTAFPTPPS